MNLFIVLLHHFDYDAELLAVFTFATSSQKNQKKTKVPRGIK